MKKFLIIIFLVSGFISIASAQARKSDEFSITYSHDNQFRLYSFQENFANDPKSFGQILVSRGEKDTPGFPYRIGAAITSFLTFRSAIEKSRIINTRCKAEKKSRIELWVVPKLEELRTCENESLNLTKTILFDSIYYNPESDYCCLIDGFDEEQYQASLEAFSNILKSNPSVKAYLFFYLGTNVYWTTDKGKIEKAVRTLDSPKLIKELVKTAKKIMSENSIESSRTVLINGGYKDSARNIELWLVPQNGEIPKAKPNYFPQNSSTKRKK